MLVRDYLKRLTTYTYEWADAIKMQSFIFQIQRLLKVYR